MRRCRAKIDPAHGGPIAEIRKRRAKEELVIEARRTAAQVASDCTLTVYDGLFHEVHNEPEQARVLADIVAWLDAHLG